MYDYFQRLAGPIRRTNAYISNIQINGCCPTNGTNHPVTQWSTELTWNSSVITQSDVNALVRRMRLVPKHQDSQRMWWYGVISGRSTNFVNWYGTGLECFLA